MTTTLGMMHLDLHVPQAGSLKDKRRIVKGFKDRIASRFNVSVAEVDYLDRHRRALIAIAIIGSDRQHEESVLSRIAEMASNHRDMVLLDRTLEWL